MGQHVVGIVFSPHDTQVGISHLGNWKGKFSYPSIIENPGLWAKQFLESGHLGKPSQPVDALVVCVEDGICKSGTVYFLGQQCKVAQVLEHFRQELGAKEVLIASSGTCQCALDKIGPAKKMRNYLSVRIQDSVQLGFFLNDGLVVSENGVGGWIGHAPINIPDLDGFIQAQPDSLHDIVSQKGVLRVYLEEQGKSLVGNSWHLVSKPELSFTDAVELSLAGDATAQKALDRVAYTLGLKLSDFVGETSPEAIFLSGSLNIGGNAFAKKVGEAVQANVLNIFKNKTKVLLSGNQDSLDAAIAFEALYPR